MSPPRLTDQKKVQFPCSLSRSFRDLTRRRHGCRPTVRSLAFDQVMKEQQQLFLARLGCPPARLTVEQTAWVLNCQDYDIPTLVRAKLLKPLGNPPLNAVKYFATEAIVRLARDPVWLARATNALYQYWQGKNRRRQPPSLRKLPKSNPIVPERHSVDHCGLNPFVNP